jgi:peptide deformylase
MFDTMANAQGVGLAAPQIGLAIRLFIVDASPFAEEEEEAQADLKVFKRIFINPTILEEKGDLWSFNEGCLSIPKIREDVYRKPTLTINYVDEKFVAHQEVLTGLPARIVQHEYDHIEGKLFIDHLKPLRRTLLKTKLNDIAKGNVSVDYKMKFALK